MFGYKVYINYILWRIGLRDVLPSAFVNAIKVKDNGEKLVKFQGFQLRADIAARLTFVQKKLPNGILIKILSGYRSLAEQKKLWNMAPDRTKVANPENGGGGHQTGGAIDLTLTDGKGHELDMGGKYLEFDAQTPTRAVKNKNRKILVDAMTAAGFMNYPNEWWHFSYGDKMWAAYSRKKIAHYGAI